MSDRNSSPNQAPLTDAVIVAVARIVDDSQAETRSPSHSDIEFQINRAGLIGADPKTQGQTVGKAKRVRATLSWALENDLAKGEQLVANLIAHIRGCGGFRESSPNFVGHDAITDAADAFRSEGYELGHDGDLRPLLLESLAGAQLTAALESYARRAKRGTADAALLIGTGKDLLEATAAHVLVEKWGSHSTQSNFPTLLGQAFTALGFSTPAEGQKPGESPQRAVERALYELGCSVNRLRNKQGTGHGRPWLPTVTDAEAHTAVEAMGVISEFMLSGLK